VADTLTGSVNGFHLPLGGLWITQETPINIDSCAWLRRGKNPAKWGFFDGCKLMFFEALQPSATIVILRPATIRNHAATALQPCRNHFALMPRNHRNHSLREWLRGCRMRTTQEEIGNASTEI